MTGVPVVWIAQRQSALPHSVATYLTVSQAAKVIACDVSWKGCEFFAEWLISCRVAVAHCLTTTTHFCPHPSGLVWVACCLTATHIFSQRTCYPHPSLSRWLAA